jgi:hypothetical protein
MDLVSDWADLRRRIAGEHGVSPNVHGDDMLWQFVLGHPAFAQPEDAVRYYFADGATSAHKLGAIAQDALAGREAFTLMEFASGYGMVTRHLRGALPGASTVTCDIHEAAVAFIGENLRTPAIISRHQPEECELGGPYDIVFALSFFSHMPPSTFGRWLGALYRAVAPGGALVFTTHGLASAASLGDPEIPESGHWFKPESEQHDLEGVSYGSALTTPECVVRELFAATGAPLMRYRPAHWWGHQDLYVVSGP